MSFPGPAGGRRRAWLLAALFVASAHACPAMAGVTMVSQRTEVEVWGGDDGEGGSVALSRLSLRSAFRLRAAERWDLDFAARLEAADDRTGLGTVDSYARASRPLVDSASVRLEIDRLILSRRIDQHHISIGKQTVPWGVLDGVQVIDRFDPVRRRDFVLSNVRPERLARWGLRWRYEADALRLDLAAALDPTVNQQARQGDRFEPQAPRQRGGFAAGEFGPAPRLVQSDRNEYLRDATYGIRLGRSFGRADASLLFLSGPELDPVLSLGTWDPVAPVVLLTHPRRKLYGASLEFAEGSRVWRMELAHIPDQPVNVLGPTPLQSERQRRSLAGLGLDWNAPHGWFVNAQLVVDRLDGGRFDAVRPDTDVIATLRVQRSYLQDTLRTRYEILGSLSDGDGVFRPVLEWQASDRLTLSVGVDWLFGTRTGLFGQFDDGSRAWIRLVLSL